MQAVAPEAEAPGIHDPETLEPIPLVVPLKQVNGDELRELTVKKPDLYLADLIAAGRWAKHDPQLTQVYLWGQITGVNPEDLRDRLHLKNYRLVEEGLSPFLP